MDNTRIYELPCLDGRKSFYGKAHILEDNNGNRTLVSYTTMICKLDKHGNLTKLDPTVTPTTRRHIRSFLRFLDIPVPANRAWDALPLHTVIPTNDLAFTGRRAGA